MRKIQSKNNTYWANRDRYFNKSLDEIGAELAKHYIKCFNDTYADLMLLYADIQAEAANGTLLISDLYKYDRYFEMLNNLQTHLSSLGNWEIKTYEKYLTDLYDNYYQLTGIELDKTNNYTLYDENQIKKIIDTDWVGDGKNWSDRIWDNKAELAEVVKNSVIEAFVRGTGSDSVAVQLEKYLKDNLQESFNSGFNVAHRLAATEMAHIQVQATVDKYKDAGVSKYKVLHGPRVYKDGKSYCCDDCMRADGQVYPIEDQTHLPPYHPNCHCSILAVLD